MCRRMRSWREALMRCIMDVQVDIYSVGIILWELVTLMTPARGNLRSVRVPEECPADMARLIEDCLNANNPDARPTASQIYDRLISRYPSSGSSRNGRRSRTAPVLQIC